MGVSGKAGLFFYREESWNGRSCKRAKGLRYRLQGNAQVIECYVMFSGLYSRVSFEAHKHN